MGLPGRCGQVFRGRGGNEVLMENVAMATKMEDVWNWLGHSRDSEIPLTSLEIPENDIVDNFQGAKKFNIAIL